MTVEQLIAAKMAERADKGFHLVVKYDNRCSFNYYASTKEIFDAKFAKFVSMIGKTDAAGSTILAVSAA